MPSGPGRLAHPAGSGRPFARRRRLDFAPIGARDAPSIDADGAGRVLGSLLGNRVAALGLARDADVLVPVPLHRSRHATRGFNQSAEIARWVSRRAGPPVDPRLAERRRATLPQVGLHLPDREANVRGAFIATAGVSGRRVVVIDDVTTTGSTLAELAGALIAAGAIGVDAWCVARADRREIQPPVTGERSP